MHLSELMEQLQKIQPQCGSADPEVRVGPHGGEVTSMMAAGLFAIDSVHDRRNWPAGSVVIDITVEPRVARYDPGTLLLWSALRAAAGVLGQHNLLTTASDEERREAIERFCAWWNRTALPMLEAVEWAMELVPGPAAAPEGPAGA
jgi:hypothetical protein